MVPPRKPLHLLVFHREAAVGEGAFLREWRLLCFVAGDTAVAGSVLLELLRSESEIDALPNRAVRLLVEFV